MILNLFFIALIVVAVVSFIVYAVRDNRRQRRDSERYLADIEASYEQSRDRRPARRTSRPATLANVRKEPCSAPVVTQSDSGPDLLQTMILMDLATSEPRHSAPIHDTPSYDHSSSDSSSSSSYDSGSSDSGSCDSGGGGSDGGSCGGD